MAPPSILLAEDNLLNQRIARLMLRRLGHAVDVVGNGRQAVEACRGRRYDLIFMDVDMPEMDGLEATRRILSGPSDGHRPYIVAFTAGAELHDCIAAGMNNYLRKPAKLEQLAQILAASLRPPQECGKSSPE